MPARSARSISFTPRATGNMSDPATALVWLSVTALLGWAAFRLAQRLFPTDTCWELVGHTVLIGYAVVVAAGTATGACGLLGSSALLITATIGSSMLTVLWRYGWSAPAREHGALPEGTTRERLAVLPPTDRTGAIGWIGVVAFLGSVAGHLVLGGLFRFPSDWDTLMYHLPMVEHWLQAGSLYAPDCLHWYNPGNNELITLWCVAPFSGDFLYSLTNLPATVLLVCGSLAVGRQLGLGAVLRPLAALAVAANQIVLYQLLDVENDVAVAGLFLVALGHALRYAATARSPELVFAGIALGLLAGVKYYALGYAAVAAGATIGLVVWRSGWTKGARATAFVVGCIFVFGSYWYLRNWAVVGSPVYPLGAASGADDIRSHYPGMWATTFMGNGAPELWWLTGEAVWRMTGPCQVVALVAFPGSFVWLLGTTAFRPVSRFGAGSGATRLAFAGAALGACGLILITPFAVEDSPGTLNQIRWGYCPVRYGLCFLSLAVLALGTLVGDLSRVAVCSARLLTGGPVSVRWGARFRSGIAVLFSSAFVASIWVQLLRHHQFLPVAAVDTILIGLNVTLTSLALRFASGAGSRSPLAMVIGGTIVLVAGLVLGIHSLSVHWHTWYARSYDLTQGDGVFEYMSHQIPTGRTVCVLDHRPYPFFGSARQFRVCQPPPGQSSAARERYLRDQGVHLIAVRFGSAHDPANKWAPFLAWLLSNPEGLTSVGNHKWSWTVFTVRADLLRPVRNE